MRKITVISMITLDGVLQGPGGPKEDTSGGFEYGGWTAPFSDEAFNKEMMKELEQQADFLLGRKTYEIWAGYWPQHGEYWPRINEGMKYVLSHSLKNTDPLIADWKHSEVVHNVEDIKKLKKSAGPDIQVWGSSELIQLLFENDLVDELKLKIYPLTLGKGKKLWGDGNIPAAFSMTSSIVTSQGIILANYTRAGEVKTGDVSA